MPLTWHCDEIYSGDVPPVLTGQDCTVTSTATTTPIEVATSTPYNGPNYHDWLFVAGVMLFFVSYMAWGRLFRPVRTLFDE